MSQVSLRLAVEPGYESRHMHNGVCRRSEPEEVGDVGDHSFVCGFGCAGCAETDSLTAQARTMYHTQIVPLLVFVSSHMSYGGVRGDHEDAKETQG